MRFPLPVDAENYNRYTIDTSNGLTSMCVLSLYQDKHGMMWVGTYDGLCVLEGNGREVARFMNPVIGGYGGCIVDGLAGDDSGRVWIHSNYGLDMYNPMANSIERHPEIRGSYRYTVSTGGEVVVLTKDQGFHYYNKVSRHFEPLPFQDMNLSDVRYMHIDDSLCCTIATHSQLLHVQLQVSSDGTLSTHLARRVNLSCRLRYAALLGDELFLIDDDGTLWQADDCGRCWHRIGNLGEEILSRGDISGLVRQSDSTFLLSFFQGGVCRVDIGDDGTSYVSPFDITSSIFAMIKDREQDIIWMATDGEGLAFFVREPYIIRNELFDNLSFPVSKPVRSIIKDVHGNIWVATKGNGLLCYRRYTPGEGARDVVQFTTSNSVLLHNSLYHLAQGTHGVIWISSDGTGINYIDPKTSRICCLEGVRAERLRSTHCIVEDDDLLWVATGGNGVFRLQLEWRGTTPVCVGEQALLYDGGQRSKAQFQCVACDASSIWCANRENGLVSIDKRTLSTSLCRFDTSGVGLSDDVTTLCIDSRGRVLCGTAGGLFVHASGCEDVGLSDALGIAGLSVRGVFCEDSAHVWVSTPRRLVVFDPSTGIADSFGEEHGIAVKEFSEGATWVDPSDGTKYVGGTNGFVLISTQMDTCVRRQPQLLITSVESPGGTVNLQACGHKVVLKQNENHLNIHFTGFNYTNVCTYEYACRRLPRPRILAAATSKGHEKGSDTFHPIETGSILLSNLSSGEYEIAVRCRLSGRVSPSSTLRICILPPWYRSSAMMVVYVALFAGLVYAVILAKQRRQQRRQAQVWQDMQQKHKEELYESKLRFFTNLTHEFGTPLTLIGCSCQRMLAANAVSGKSRTYLTVIQNSTLRMNGLVQQMIEYRRLETGNRKMNIQPVVVSDALREIFGDFSIEAEQNAVSFACDIVDGITWNTDEKAFHTIAINLISNAFKYVSERGWIEVKLCVAGDADAPCLQLSVSNTGEAISPEERRQIFDRYHVLHELENIAEFRGFARCGLGLAITSGLTTELGGCIDVVSRDSVNTFVVSLPMPAVACDALDVQRATAPSSSASVAPSVLPDLPTSPAEVAGKPVIVVADDDPELVWLLQDLLQTNYNVIPLTDASLIDDSLAVNPVDLLIVDILLDGQNGLEICRRLKSDKRTKHIPVIVISSLPEENARMECMDAGADLFIQKPFDGEYLAKAVDAKIKNATQIREYCNSYASSFDIAAGKRLHKEERQFLDQIMQVIRDNLANPGLTTGFVADQMGISVRGLYRRLETITDVMPKDIIRDMRLERAKQLIVKSKMTMEEVCYATGFGNRGNFYKLFAAKFGCTPGQLRDMNRDGS